MIRRYTQDEIDRFTEHYDCIDPDTGYEYDIEPEIEEDENATKKY
jgi:hypothetical protein